MALNVPWAEIKTPKKSPNHLAPHSDNSLKIKMKVFPFVFPVHYLPHSGQYPMLKDQVADSVITWQSWHKDSSKSCISYPAQVLCLGHCSAWAWEQDGLRLHLPALSLLGSSATLLLWAAAPHEVRMWTHREKEGKSNIPNRITASKILYS